LSSFILNNTDDIHRWRFEASGQYSTRSAYRKLLLAPSPLNRGSDFGNHGLQVNAKPLFGWPFRNAAGQQIDCKKEVSNIRNVALSATKMKRLPSFCMAILLLYSAALKLCSFDA
jgi:hypothetical protein